MNCDFDRLITDVNRYKQFGKTIGGGVTRLTLTEPDLLARRSFVNECEEAGLLIKYDDIGNIYGWLPGTENLAPIVMGSHLDSVEKGGNYDGVLGVLTAKEVIKTILDNDISLRHPLVVANFTNEEGVRFSPAIMGSGIISGHYDEAEMLAQKDSAGVTFGKALSQSGFVGYRENRLTKATAFIELHIEQGPVLEATKKDIGIVEGVAGMVCYQFHFHGKSDHAGTTPMRMREDPLFTATSFINEVKEKLSKIDQTEELVFTIGSFTVKPNIHHVIPAEVNFTLDIRHKDPAMLEAAKATIDASAYGHEKLEYRIIWRRDTINFDAKLLDVLTESVDELKYQAIRFYSGAGHDAQFIAKIAPTAMVFVPSVDGKSHCEIEQTSEEDCWKGANVLLKTVLAIDKNGVMEGSSYE